MFGKTKFVDTLAIAENQAQHKLGMIDGFMKELEEAEFASQDLRKKTETQIARLQDVVKKCEKVEKFVKGIMKK